MRVTSSIIILLASLGAVASAQETIFSDTHTGNDSGPEGTFYELGTGFRASVAGSVTHLRVYSLATESGAHTARMLRNSDNTVISGPHTWTYGGTTGWTTFDIPDVTLSADTDYTVVFASAKNRVSTPLHTNFKLGGPGE